MNFVQFIDVQSPAPIPSETHAAVGRLLADLPGLMRGLLYVPSVARDLFHDDGPGPALSAQLYYPDIMSAEATMAEDGPLQALRGLLGENVTISHQVMVVRPYPPAEATYQTPEGERPCAYMVHYAGQAEDYNAWISHYLDHHPQIMHRFPRIREVEVYTRADWRDALDWIRVQHVQRNRLIFDSRDALEAALQSPVRHEMRADFHLFPPYEGAIGHYPMLMDELTA